MILATPQDVLAYWIGNAAEDPKAAGEMQKLWFGKSDTVDAEIAERFLPTLGAMTAGLAEDWAERGPRQRLAAIIVLDQFARNLFRGQAEAFEHDRLALGLAKDGILRGEDKTLSEVERVFFYLPLEHSERQADQVLSVELMTRVRDEARPGFEGFAQGTLDYAHAHKDIIDRFGRYPHRNAALGRESTPEEAEFLKQPGSGF